jgi:hypothetical protein
MYAVLGIRNLVTVYIIRPALIYCLSVVRCVNCGSRSIGLALSKSRTYRSRRRKSSSSIISSAMSSSSKLSDASSPKKKGKSCVSNKSAPASESVCSDSTVTVVSDIKPQSQQKLKINKSSVVLELNPTPVPTHVEDVTSPETMLSQAQMLQLMGYL